VEDSLDWKSGREANIKNGRTYFFPEVTGFERRFFSTLTNRQIRVPMRYSNSTVSKSPVARPRAGSVAY